MKAKYIKWFFDCILQCMKDLPYEIYTMGEIKLMKENWQDFKTKIYFDKDPEVQRILKDIDDLTDKK